VVARLVLVRIIIKELQQEILFAGGDGFLQAM
jgi:hypothetical protein